MEDVLVALTELVKAQGEQIIELSRSLAIAHEHHNHVGIPVSPPVNDIDREKLYLSEEEEDEQYADTHLVDERMRDILIAAGLDPTLTHETP